MILTSYSPTDYRVTPWKNGGGTTLELLLKPAPGGDFLWRISIADVDASGAFSSFPGIDRQIMLVSGKGMKLDFGALAAPAFISRPFEPFAFRGEWPTECRLIEGPVKDFNLMVRRDWGFGMLTGLILDKRRRVSPAPAPMTLVHVFAGAISCLGRSFASGATLQIETAEEKPIDIATLQDETRIAVATLRPQPAF